MTDFASDNTSGIYPDILNAILKVNSGHAQSYGMDDITEKMQRAFRRVFDHEVDVYLVFNGTAANVLSLSACIDSFEGVICSESSHLSLDECSAPEKWLGSKLFLTPHLNGKLDLAAAEKHLIRMGDQHYSQPRALSIAQPTEWGTSYTLEELRYTKSFCTKHGLYFHLDGARLANSAAYLDCTLAELTTAIGVDALSLGGAKNGMLGVEAVVFFKKELSENFKFRRKQALQLASKHRFMSAQFLAYFENDLWKKIALHQHKLALLLCELVQDLPDVKIVAPVQSNAVFAKIPASIIHALKKEFFFYVWDESQNIVRWMITWDHTEQDIRLFSQTLARLISERPEIKG